ncbi:Dihydropteroate synthase [Neoconidiobolus thromboides FSU 785]|nr:Dihydropteroate synthase [Neoconidiobolus thromboides FSU 785]
MGASEVIVKEIIEKSEIYRDKLIVRGLNGRSVVGGDHWDRPKLQPIILDIIFYTNIEACGESDILAHSLSYSDLASEALDVSENSTHESFKDLAQKICYRLLTKFQGSKVTISVQKPKGLLHAENSGYEITRTVDNVNIDSDLNRDFKDDRLFINSLRLNTIIGVHSWEREAKQVVLIHLNLYPGAQILGNKSKKPHNYRTLVATLSKMIEESKFKTVEALATSIARITIVNCNYPKVTVRVEKPSALRFAAAAAAEITRDASFFEQDLLKDETILNENDVASKALDDGTKTSSVALIAFGSNLGDRYKNIVDGIKSLKEAGCELLDTSFLYETAPMYVLDQPKFLNGACKVRTTLSPLDLLKTLKKIEQELGRTPTIRNGPRLVDLDILYYDNVEMDTEVLTLPHPRIAEREFVLQPLNDISPDWEHPKLHNTVKQLLFRLTYDQGHSEVVKVLPLKNQEYWYWGSKTYIMGILNITHDSFSDGGDYLDLSSAVIQAKKLINDGADILDIGGASTRPDADPISVEEEIARVVPVISKLREEGLKCLISVDTFHSKVAEEAIKAGADLINDVSGGGRDPKMFEVMAHCNVPVCLMHMRGDSKTMNSLTQYGSGEEGQVMRYVQLELSKFIGRAISSGVYRWNIIVDPGIGFAKNTEQNLELIRSLPQIGKCGSFPCLFGASRKRFIGSITGRENPKERDWGTAATCTAAIAGGADILRIHEVKELKDVIVVSDALYRVKGSKQ